jgi:hypothetical protein
MAGFKSTCHAGRVREWIKHVRKIRRRRSSSVAGFPAGSYRIERMPIFRHVSLSDFDEPK